MQRFKINGKSLSVDITYAAARSLTKQLGVTLCDPATSARMGTAERYDLLPEVLTVLCRDEILRNWPDLKVAGDQDQAEMILGFLDEQLGPEPQFKLALAAFTEEWASFLERRLHHEHARFARSLTRFVDSDVEATEANFAKSVAAGELTLQKRAATVTPGPTSSDGAGSSESTAASIPSQASA